MNSHAVTLAALFVLASTFAPAADAPRFAPAEGTSVEKTFTVTTHLTTDSMQVSIDGEVVESGWKITMDDTTRIVVSDEYVKVGKGRPLVLERTYEKMSGKGSQTTEVGGESDETTKEQESKLTGKTVKFTWDADDESYDLSFADEEGGTDLLEDVDEDMDLRAFLPEADAKDGATWSVKGHAARIFMFPGGDLKLEDTEKDEDESGQDELDRSLRENIDSRIEAKLDGTREEDGRTFAVITLDGEITSKGETDSEESGKVEVGISGRVTGKILWDMAARRVHSASVSVEQTISYSRSADFESRSYKEELQMSGTTSFELETSK